MMSAKRKEGQSVDATHFPTSNVFIYTWDAAEALEELVDLLEVLVAELDEGRRLEHAVGRHLEGAVRQRVEVAHDQQQVGRLLHRQEARPAKEIWTELEIQV